MVGCLLAGWLYKKDTEVEDRRRSAIKLAAAMRNKGLTRVADFYENYAVGDYSGMLKGLKDAAVLLSHDASLQGEFAVVFDKLLAEKLADPAAAATVAKTALQYLEAPALAEVGKLATQAASVAAVVA